MRKKRSEIDMAAPLKFWRARRGYSQTKLAELAQTSALTIGQLESGKRKARGKTLEKILAGLKLSEAEFFAMREGGSAPALTAVPSTASSIFAKPAETAKPASATKETPALRLSNLDLELLNRILNLDFDGKVETLKFLQNLS